MNIRIYNNNDINEILKLSGQFKTSPFTFDKRFTKLFNIDNSIFIKEIIEKQNVNTLVIEDNNKIIGFISFINNEKISEVLGYKIANILLLSVDENYRNHGIGKYLVQKSLVLLKNYGVKLVTVGTDIYNIPAIHVYESSGFKFQFCWHIYRFIPGLKKVSTKIYENIDIIQNENNINEFLSYINRPVSLLRDPVIDKSKLITYFNDKIKKDFKSGSLMGLCYYLNNKPLGLISYIYDKISQKTFNTSKLIIKIMDVVVKDEYKYKNIEKKMVQDLINRLKEYAFIECWVSCDDSNLIEVLENCGFSLSYTGISLHCKL